MRICTKCKIEKNENQFHKKRNGKDTRCKECVKVGLRRWRNANREKYNEWNRQYFRDKTNCHCPYCLKPFIKSSNEKFCCVKCHLMGNIKKINGCWIWQGAKDSKGYGRITVNYRIFGAHRLSFELFKGSIEKNKNICHTCDNPSCIKPDHLWIGTQKENMQDKMKKGRHVSRSK